MKPACILFLLLHATLTWALAAAPSGKMQQLSSPDQVPEGLQKSDWSNIREAHRAWEHSVMPDGDGWQARNPGQQWTTRFDGRGFLTKPKAADWQWGLELRSYGFGAMQKKVNGKPQEVTAEGSRLSYQWDADVREWFINDQRGLEHGFTVERRPEGATSGAALDVVVGTRGTLKASVAADAQTVHFRDALGAPVVTYAGLKVWDARGQVLPSHFVTGPGGEFILRVEESEARYPITIDPIAQQAQLKASNTGNGDFFGGSVAVSGNTVVVGAPYEDSTAIGVNGNGPDVASSDSGAAYIFVRNGSAWSQQAYLKASNTGSQDRFGESVAVSGDTVVVGAYLESSSATGVNGNQANNSAQYSGAAYVFVRNGTTWSQQAYLKASNTESDDQFGFYVAVSGDTVIVEALNEDSNATGVNGNQADNSAPDTGADYVFVRNGTIWSQQAYIKAGSQGPIAVSDDTIAKVSDQMYTKIYVRNGTAWSQQASLLPSNYESSDYVSSVALSGDTLVVGASYEDSNAKGVNGNQASNSASFSGAAYVFVRDGITWTQQAYLKASNTEAYDLFGSSVAVSGDIIVIGAHQERSNATGVNGNQTDNSLRWSGAAYVFVRNNNTWRQDAYLKPSDTIADMYFGLSVGVSYGTAVIGSSRESAYVFSGIGIYALVTSAINGTITGAGEYQTGAIATLSATPSFGYIFTGWTGSATGITNPLSLLMDNNKTIGATFSRIAPTISDIPDVAINEDGSTGARVFTISDLITPASSLSVAGSSSNPGLVPNGNIVFGGSGGSRTVTVTPLTNQNGSSLITVTVGNGGATATETFLVTVTSVNDAPTISTVSNTVIDEDTLSDALAFTVGDVETTVGSLVVTAQSSNTTLVPTANILPGGTGSLRTVTVTPAANQYGSAIITLTVGDGSAVASTNFVLTVNPVNDAPTISGIADRSINSGTNTGTIGFTVGDLESVAGDLTVTASSDNTVLVSNTGIVIGGSGASRTITITPVATQAGAAVITVSVSDGLLTSIEIFVLTVQETPFGQDFVWAKGFGGSGSDTAYSIATDSLGNAMVAVDFTGTVPFGTFSLTASGSSGDLALLKVAADGNVLSAAHFGGVNPDYAKAVAVDASDNMILAGEFTTSTLIGGVTHTSVGSKDISLLKVNSAGTLQWSKRFGGTLSDSVYGLATDADGNILLAGDFSGSITFGATTLSSSGGRDGFVAKLDPSGTPLWAMKVGGSGNDTAYSVTVSPFGQILVGGSFSLTATFGTISRTSAGGTDGFAMGVSSAGAVQWATRFGGSANDSARAVALDGMGAACLAGSFAGTDATFGAEILASEGADDVFVARLSAADGSFLIVKQCGGSGADGGLGLAADPFGALYLSGSYSGTAYFDGNTLITPQGPDAFVAKLSLDGNFLWALEGGGAANDSATSIAANQAGHVFVAGLFAQSARIGSHDVTAGGLVDFFVAKINGPTPSFVSTPGSVTVDVGDPFSIAAPAVGADPITYQWFKGASPLVGKTSFTLLVTAASTGDQGMYHVVATNQYGSTQLADVSVTVRVPDRVLSLAAPATSEENRTLEVPLYLDSDGEVTGLTLELAYDRDLLRNPSFDVGKDLSKQNSTVVVDTVAGTVRVVGTAYPSSIPAGHRLIGTFKFITRSVPENAVAVFTPTLASISNQFGAPLGGYTKIVGDQTSIARRTIPGDANNNGRLDVSDAAELIRLYANPAQIRTWDNFLNDLNLDGVLTEGDATRVLRVVAKRDNTPSFPAATPLTMLSTNSLAGTDSSSMLMLGSNIAAMPTPAESIPNAAQLVLSRLSGADANKVLAQIYLNDVPIGQTGISFQLDYPASVLRIAGASSLTIPAGGLPVEIAPTWNVEPGNDYANQTGSVLCAAAWSAAWNFINGQAVAHVVFEINPAASGQVHFPLTLTATEISPFDAEGPSTPLAMAGEVVTFSRTYADWALATLGSASADPNVDSDGDGVSNALEFAASTNPGDANSSLKTTAAEHTTAGFMLRWFAAYGVNYRVRWSGDLVIWENLVSQYPGTGAEAEANDPDAPAGGRFYRVEVIPAP